MIDHVHVVGCGGIGCWVAQFLCRRHYGESSPVEEQPGMNVVLWDHDRVEEGNLSRQLFGPDDVGEYKVEALKKQLSKSDGVNITYIPRRFTELSDDGEHGIMCCADNHLARRNSLEAVDEEQTVLFAIIMGNSVDCAEAMLYLPEWRDTPNDPRCRYPEIGTAEQVVETNSCAAAVEAGAAQTTFANVQAATTGMWLYQFVTQYQETVFAAEAVKPWPARLYSNYLGIHTERGEVV